MKIANSTIRNKNLLFMFLIVAGFVLGESARATLRWECSAQCAQINAWNGVSLFGRLWGFDLHSRDLAFQRLEQACSRQSWGAVPIHSWRVGFARGLEVESASPELDCIQREQDQQGGVPYYDGPESIGG